MNNEIALLMKNIREEQELIKSFDVDELLQSIEKDGYEYLENKTFKIIAEENFKELQKHSIPDTEIPLFCDKLTDFFLIKNKNDFRKSHQVRYMKKGETKLRGEWRLANVFTNEKGILYVGLIIGKRYINVRYDDCIFFQKLTPEEKLILLSFDIIQDTETNYF